MKRLLFTALLFGAGTAFCSAADFEKPVKLMVGNTAIRVEAPGWACPCWADLHRDGTRQLLVGQFDDGKIRVYKHLRANQFAPGEWLKADGKVAQVPGVW
jgi:hypothetical protein